MLNTRQINKLFTTDGHLSEEGIAIWVDALQYKKTDSLPEKIREHVEGCVVCKSSVINTYSVLEQEAHPFPEHPYFDDADNKTKRLSKRKINLWYKIAAAVLILLSMMAILLFQLRENKDSGELFAEYFSPYPNIITIRNSTQTEQNKTFVAALNSYNNGDYRRASQLFEELNKIEVLSDTVLFYYGNSSLASGDVNQAIVLFEQLLSDTNSRFVIQAEWYIALAYLSSDKTAQCLQHLKKVIDEDTYHKTKARELYKKIE